MFIKNIKVKNFKSFKELDIDLGQLNVFIGANASGKSNFVQLVKFLRDSEKEGLKNAISLQFGTEYFRNINLKPREPFDLNVLLQLESADFVNNHNNNNNNDSCNEINYLLNLNFIEDEPGFHPNVHRKICNFHFKENNIDEEVNINIFDGIHSYGGKDIHEKIKDYIPDIILILKRISIFDFDLKAAKEGSKKGKADLEEDAANLALVLDNILKNEEKKRKFLNLLNLVLPFTESLNTSKHFDGSKVFNLKEKYNQNELPSFLLSDGTISITALIVALYFENKPVIVFEEPDRGIHPHLISETMEMFKEVSQSKQILLTTHNPEVLKHVELDNIYLVSRDKEGFSQITKPANSEVVREFLNNELGISDLFIDNMLGL